MCSSDLADHVPRLGVDGGGVPGFQVGAVQLEHTEAGVSRPDVRPGAADALLADLADVGVARFGRLALLSQTSGSCTRINRRLPPSSALSCMTA